MQQSVAILFDLDNTLVLTDALLEARRRRAWSNVYSRLGETIVPPGTHAFIRKVSTSFLVGVVTNSPRTYASKLLAFHNIPVPVLVAYHDVSNRKPSPEPILKAASILGVLPTACFYVGDEDTDVIAAEAAGARALLVAWGGQNKSTVASCPVCYEWTDVIREVSRISHARWDA